MSCNLLIDFGASRVKTAVYKDGQILDIKNYNPVKPYDICDRKFVVSLREIEKLFREIINSYAEQYKIDGIYICSEMHGFAILDRDNKPISDYISWKDERSLNSSFEYLKENYGELFFNKTGMRPRPCYPFFNLFEYLKTNHLKEAKIVSLPDWLCAVDGKSCNISHVTMNAGLGFYNIFKKITDKELTEIFEKKYKVKLLFNEVSDGVKIGGYINNIPIYTGVGDHQCAVLGAGNSEDTISLNLGTGSQVGFINSESKTAEKRPFFEGKLMSVVTHIPSGRSFNCFIRFLSEINPKRDFWKELSEITLEELVNSTLNIDLAIFSSAWNFTDYGKISNINEQNFNLKNYVASILKSYVKQYEKAIEFIGEKRENIILSGGIAQKLPVIEEYFSQKGYKTYTTDKKTDETLLGLCIIIDNK